MSFNKFMRHVKFGRSLAAIFFSAMLMIFTYCISDPIIGTFKTKGIKTVFLDDYIYLIVVDAKGKEYRTRQHEALDAYINRGVREFTCDEYRSSDVKCGHVGKK